MRILMISYPFPPWGGNTKRAVLQANHLSDCGHDVTVLAVDPSPRLPGYDTDLAKLISAKVHVSRTFAGVLHHLSYRLLQGGRFERCGRRTGSLSWCRQKLLEHLLFPMRTLEWFPWGLSRALRLFRAKHFDVVYSHGDPYVAHLVALWLKKLVHRPWVMYISDPRYLATDRVNKSALRWLEALCLSEADRVIVNCDETLEAYVQGFAEAKPCRFATIMDGFEASRYRAIAADPGTKFRIVFTGRLYDDGQEPEAFLNALDLIPDIPLEILFVGFVGRECRNWARQSKSASSKVAFLGYQRYERLIALQKGASVLLAFGRNGGYQVPGKLFEYFGARRPILIIRSDVRDVASKYILRYRRGVVSNDDPQEIAASVRMLYGLWRANELDSRFDLAELQECSMELLVSRFEAEILRTLSAA